MPPADGETAAGVLRLHVASHFSSELGPMVFDYAGESSATRDSHILLVGLRQEVLEDILAFCAAAGVKAIAITATGLELAGIAAANGISDGLVLALGTEAIELSVLRGSETRSLRRIGSLGAPKPLIAELRRAAVSASTGLAGFTAPEADKPSKANSRGLVIWNEAVCDRATLDSLAGAADLPTVRPNPGWVDIPSSDLTTDSAGQAIGLWAFALTRRMRAGKRTMVDFLHPRLAQRRDPFERKTLWFAGACAMVILLILAALFELAHLSRQVDRTEAQLQAMAPDLARARPFVESTQFVESFHCDRPRYLACLRDLTADILPESPVSFTSFVLRTDMHGDISGRAGAEQNILALTDKLTTSGRFSELKWKLDAHQVKNAGNEVSFSVTFTYLPRV
jgi:hypothetical protein